MGVNILDELMCIAFRLIFRGYRLNDLLIIFLNVFSRSLLGYDKFIIYSLVTRYEMLRLIFDSYRNSRGEFLMGVIY